MGFSKSLYYITVSCHMPP